MARDDRLCNSCGVLTLSPTFMESKVPAVPTLLEQAQAGDVEAFGEICHSCETRLLRQAMTLCGNSSLAEELAQDTLVEAWKNLARFGGRCQFFTWLCAILLNRYRNFRRERRPVPFSAYPRREQDDFREGLAKIPAHDAQPDESAELLEQSELVRACIEALPLKHQQVIFLRFYVDDSLDGIAVALGCSVGTVKSRLYHALEKLRGMNILKQEHAEIKQRANL